MCRVLSCLAWFRFYHTLQIGIHIVFCKLIKRCAKWKENGKKPHLCKASLFHGILIRLISWYRSPIVLLMLFVFSSVQFSACFIFWYLINTDSVPRNPFSISLSVNCCYSGSVRIELDCIIVSDVCFLFLYFFKLYVKIYFSEFKLMYY